MYKALDIVTLNLVDVNMKYTRCLFSSQISKKSIFGDLATLLFHWGKRISIRYKAADIVMLYLVYVNVKYHHIQIQKQISKCTKT